MPQTVAAGADIPPTLGRLAQTAGFALYPHERLKPLPKSHLSVARAVTVSGTDTHNVEIEFSQRGVESLAALLGTSDPTNAFVDWYAAGHRAGEPITAMRAVLTSQNVALLPFSVNDVVGQGLVDQPIVIAKELTPEAATKLVRFLGF